MFESRNPTAFSAPGRLSFAQAVALSIVIHALALGAGSLSTASRPAPKAAEPPLQARLMPPQRQPAPVLVAPEPVASAAANPPKARPKTVPPSHASAPVRAALDATTVASRQIAERLLYPPEAIARGLEGEAWVRLFLDETGDAITARLERSSGHALLDDAAVHAARAVRALPDGVPHELVLPVRFRLR